MREYATQKVMIARCTGEAKKVREPSSVVTTSAARESKDAEKARKRAGRGAGELPSETKSAKLHS